MCGEHCCTCALMPAIVGSSPHVRGAPITKATVPMMNGIIPACAGSTFRPRGHVSGYRDHPRMCGEHRTSWPNCEAKAGSSPHVRGARLERDENPSGSGIIPACAGSTGFLRRTRARRRDHPRMCGEHQRFDDGEIYTAGSSPHVRGAQENQGHHWWCRGIIPACAGSTQTLPVSTRPYRDHPRMCGEHDPPCWSLHVFQGSSPHVRGAPKGRSGSKDGTGIIPACAGSTP